MRLDNGDTLPDIGELIVLPYKWILPSVFIEYTDDGDDSTDGEFTAEKLINKINKKILICTRIVVLCRKKNEMEKYTL